MSLKGRPTLKEYFEAGKLPSQNEFADLIESHLNQNDDQLYIKTTEGPEPTKYLGVGAVNPTSRLTVKAHGEDEKLISFESPGGIERWKIGQNVNNKPGLNIGESGVMDSQLFIESGSGRIGIGTMDPEAKLEANGALYSRDQKNQDNGYLHLGAKGQSYGSTIQYLSSKDHLSIGSGNKDHLTIKDDGKVGINTPNPETQLHINGGLKLQEGATVNNFSSDHTFSSDSDGIVPTEKAIKDYIRYHIRDNIWWSEAYDEAYRHISSNVNRQIWVNIPNMTAKAVTSGRPVMIFFKAGNIQGSYRSHAEFRILVDGMQRAYCMHDFYHGSWESRDVSMSTLLPLSAGEHEIFVQWSVRAYRNTALYAHEGGSRSLVVIEI